MAARDNYLGRYANITYVQEVLNKPTPGAWQLKVKDLNGSVTTGKAWITLDGTGSFFILDGMSHDLVISGDGRKGNEFRIEPAILQNSANKIREWTWDMGKSTWKKLPEVWDPLWPPDGSFRKITNLKPVEIEIIGPAIVEEAKKDTPVIPQEFTRTMKFVGYIGTADNYLMDSSGLSLHASGYSFTDIINVNDLRRRNYIDILPRSFVPPPEALVSRSRKVPTVRPKVKISISVVHDIDAETKGKIESMLMECFEGLGATQAAMHEYLHNERAPPKLPAYCAWALKDEDDDVEVSDQSSTAKPRICGALLFEVLPQLRKGALGRALMQFIASQASGVGSQLLEHCCDYLCSEGISWLYSAADIESVGAVDAHYRWGFEFISRRDWMNANLLSYEHEPTIAYSRLRISNKESASSASASSSGDAAPSTEAGQKRLPPVPVFQARPLKTRK